MSKKFETWKDLYPAPYIYLDENPSTDVKTGDWRTMRPVFYPDRCIHCLFCWVYCPDSAIIVKEGKVQGINYDYCKGCGICAQVCPKQAHAIEMEQEVK